MNSSHWMPLSDVTSLPPLLCAWITSRGSMTARLKSVAHGTFAVKVLTEHWGKPTLSEARFLSLNPQDTVFIRESHLMVQDQPWLFGRIIIPRTADQALRQLGEIPLGEILFADQTVSRGPFEVRCLHAGEPDYRKVANSIHAAPKAIWARRSIFTYHHQLILVTEYFLPAIGQGVKPRGQVSM